MRSFMASIRRALRSVIRPLYWISVAGRLVLQPAAALVGLELFTHEEAEAGMEHVGAFCGKAWDVVAEPVQLVGKGLVKGVVGVGAAAMAVVSAPGRVLGAVSRAAAGGPGPQPTAAAVGNDAVNAVIDQQRKADDAADARETIQVLRRVLSARARGDRPQPDMVDRLPPRLAAYVSGLTTEECGKLASRPTAALRIILSGRGIEGVRSPEEVAAAQDPAAMLAAKHTAVRDAVKEAIGSRPKPTVRSVDDIMAEMQRAG